MARAIRVEYPGALYHVTSRGNERNPIFRDDQDRRALLGYLAEAQRRFGWLIGAYVLMTNHFHFVIETPDTNLSRGMQFVNGSYAAYFNARHRRVGHLFGERFKALLIEKNQYLREVIRYVVLNPVRASMVGLPQEYPWSSYRATAGLEDAPDWLALEPLVSYFGERDSWRANYCQFVSEKIGVEDDLWAGLVGQVYLGGERWLKSIRGIVESRMRSDEHPEVQRMVGRPTMDAIVKAVGDVFDLAPRTLRHMRGGTARKIAAWLGRYEGAHRLRKIAATLRLRSCGRVTDLIAEAEQLLRTNSALQQLVDTVYAVLA